jgi:MinD-like ATPase involved in chromosome partitioning or flagellar assembly
MKVEFEVPSERDVPVSINRGVPIALANPRAGVVKSLGEIADKLVPMRTPASDDKKKSKRLGR